MNRENIIIVTDGDNYEAWGSLTEICKFHEISHNYLKRFKFPFEYRGLKFVKVPFRSMNGVEQLKKIKKH